VGEDSVEPPNGLLTFGSQRGNTLSLDILTGSVNIDGDPSFKNVVTPGGDPVSASDGAETLFLGSADGNIVYTSNPLTNTVNIDVKTGPEFVGPVSSGGASKQGTFYGATLQNDTADITIQPGHDLTPNGRVNIGSIVSGKDGSLMITRNTYSTVFGQGFWSRRKLPILV
jgi:hypothetical protein